MASSGHDFNALWPFLLLHKRLQLKKRANLIKLARHKQLRALKRSGKPTPCAEQRQAYRNHCADAYIKRRIKHSNISAECMANCTHFGLIHPRLRQRHIKCASQIKRLKTSIGLLPLTSTDPSKIEAQGDHTFCR